MKTHIATAWKHIRRSPYQAISAIMIMVVTFLVVSIFSILTVGSSRVISYFESKPEVTAFFHDEATIDNINNLENQLSSSGKVEHMKFVSKQEALQIYKQENQNDPLLLDLVTADVLPSSLEISTYKLSDLQNIAVFLSTNPIVEKVVFEKSVVSTLATWTNAIRYIGLGLITVLSITSILIMVTIIGMKISQKKEEIEVMQLIGATKWYISWPFLFEGMFYGIIGAFIGWTISASGLFFLQPTLTAFFKNIPLFPVPLYFYSLILGGDLLLAVLLGWFASLIAVRRYIK